MAQLWINVPADRKLAPPEHHALDASVVPEFDLGGATARLFAGSLAGEEGPAPMSTPVLVAHVTVEPGRRIEVPVPAGWVAAYTVVAGAIDVTHRAGEAGTTVVFADDGEAIEIASGEGGEVLVMAGEPIGEPIVMGGGHVMTSRADIEQAFADEAAGVMGELEPSR